MEEQALFTKFWERQIENDAQRDRAHSERLRLPSRSEVPHGVGTWNSSWLSTKPGCDVKGQAAPGGVRRVKRAKTIITSPTRVGISPTDHSP
jgi:hypothetical protein